MVTSRYRTVSSLATTATLGPPGRSSSSEYQRPSCGLTPNTSASEAVVRAAVRDRQRDTLDRLLAAHFARIRVEALAGLVEAARHAFVHGWQLAMWVAAGLLVVAAAFSAVWIHPGASAFTQIRIEASG